MADALSTSTPRRSLRDDNAAEMRELLLATAFELIEAGSEPTMRAIAQHARVGERTVYRYFASHDVLIAALTPKMVGRTGIPLCATFAELEDYARELFSTFDANRALNIALLSAPWAAPFFTRSRTKNLADLRALIDAAFPSASGKDRAAAAASLRALLSGSGWHYLRVSCELSNAEVIANVQWTIRVCADRLRRATPTPHRRPR